MQLSEDVEEITLAELRRFIEQALRAGAPEDTRVHMIARRTGITTMQIGFDPSPYLPKAFTITQEPEREYGTYSESKDDARMLPGTL